jgi:hypothetical protein
MKIESRAQKIRVRRQSRKPNLLFGKKMFRSEKTLCDAFLSRLLPALVRLKNVLSGVSGFPPVSSEPWD